MTSSLLRNDIMRFSVLGFRSDIRIELKLLCIDMPLQKKIKQKLYLTIDVEYMRCNLENALDLRSLGY